jgi:hypothetical protein
MPPKQVVDRGPGYSVSASDGKRAIYGVGDLVAQCRPKDAGGGGFTVGPDRKRRLEVTEIDPTGTIKQGID